MMFQWLTDFMTSDLKEAYRERDEAIALSDEATALKERAQQLSKEFCESMNTMADDLQSVRKLLKAESTRYVKVFADMKDVQTANATMRNTIENMQSEIDVKQGKVDDAETDKKGMRTYIEELKVISQSQATLLTELDKKNTGLRAALEDIHGAVIIALKTPE